MQNAILDGGIDFVYTNDTKLIAAIDGTGSRTVIKVGPIPADTDAYGRSIYLVGVLSAIANTTSFGTSKKSIPSPVIRMYQAIQMYVDSGYESNVYAKDVVAQGLSALKEDFGTWAKRQVSRSRQFHRTDGVGPLFLGPSPI